MSHLQETIDTDLITRPPFGFFSFQIFISLICGYTSVWSDKLSLQLKIEAGVNGCLVRAVVHLTGDYIECPTRYRTRHFFNNFTTNEDIATKFEADLPQCVRNVTTS